MAGFVHLHLHSEYSLLDGACRIADIPKIAKECGHTAVALTDHGVMYGAVAFYKACKAEGIQPIIGCEVYVAPRSRFDKNHEQDATSYHLVLLVENEIGYQNLIHLVSKAFTEGFYSKPRVDMELLEAHHDGLIALSACLGGYLPKAILSGSYEKAKEYAVKMRDLFGKDHFYIEIQNHFLEEQRSVTPYLISLAAEYQIPLVATNDVHYCKRTDANTQAVLMCIQTNRMLAEGRPLGFRTDEFYYKSTEEMTQLFGNYESALENTQKIADRCHFDFNFDALYLPKFHPQNGQSAKDSLTMLTEQGFQTKIQQKQIVFTEENTEEVYQSRIAYELSIILSMGYAEYYLIVWDFVHYAKSQGIPTGPGRGSGAGSLVAFLIDITEVDSIQYHLLFERFLNPERISMPDFDIDFCYNRREEVIAYVGRKFGEDHVAQIITFGTLAAKAVIRDVGRVLGMSYDDVDRIAKVIPRELDITLKKALETPALKKLYDAEEQTRLLLDTAAALEGMPRHASTHAAGVVITDQPVVSYVPLAENKGVVVTQYDMDTIASLGLLKFDFLGLRYLTILATAEKQIQETEPTFHLDKISIEDKASYELIAHGHTDGVFQLESPGIRQMILQIKPANIEDIISSIALYRPGPMESIPKYIENRNHPERLHYKIPALAPILNLTCGCILYQEQVMQIFRVIAGYSYGQADIVRRAMAKKKANEMEKERERFLLGAVERGAEPEAALELFEEMASFAKYAFNKSHAAAYSILTYRTAYLKAHYPCQYMASLLTSVLDNPQKIAEYIAACTHSKIAVLPPDINESQIAFHVSHTGIRFGLLAIKSVSELFLEKMILEREKSPFSSFEDFMERMAAYNGNKRQIEALIKSGALDAFGLHRSQMLAVYESMMDHFVERNRTNIEGQMDLFSMTSDQKIKKEQFQYPNLPELTQNQQSLFERESIGLSFPKIVRSKTIYFRIENMQCPAFHKICNLIEIFTGSTPIVFYDSSTRKYIRYTESGVEITPFLLKEYQAILGETNVTLQ